MKTFFKLTLASSLLVASLAAFSFEGTMQVTNDVTNPTVEATFNLTVLPMVGVTAVSMTVEGRFFAPVETDALDFLASGERTDALDSFLGDLRVANPQLDQVTDREIVQAIVSAQ